VPGRAAVAPGSATPELDSTHMNGLIDDKKRSVVPTVQSKVFVCLRSYLRNYLSDLHRSFVHVTCGQGRSLRSMTAVFYVGIGGNGLLSCL